MLLADVSEEAGTEAAKAIGGDAPFVRCDVADESSWKATIAAALERFGRLDVLVNNAGIMIPGDIESGTVEDWHRIMDVNGLGVFLGCKHAIPAMRRGGGGSIVNLSSTAGLVGTPPYAAYSAQQGRRAHPHQERGAALQAQGRRHPLQLDPPRRHRHAPWCTRSGLAPA